jgi:tRNA 2-selenouridine synthase
MTGCGKTRLLHALERAGNQVLDLEGLASHRGSLLGAIPGESQPTQKRFDSLLLDRLRTFDVARPVWVEAESKKIGSVQ